jgi:hypothetical protein
MKLATEPRWGLTLKRSPRWIGIKLDTYPPTIGKLAHSKVVHSHGNDPGSKSDFAEDLAIGLGNAIARVGVCFRRRDESTTA